MTETKAPKWCPNAIPTERGWENPATGELYKSQKLTQEQIDSFYEREDAAQVLTEAPVGNVNLDGMTKTELEALARHHGVELDRRLKKRTLVETVKKLFTPG